MPQRMQHRAELALIHRDFLEIVESSWENEEACEDDPMEEAR
jgi:hypothetical protein